MSKIFKTLTILGIGIPLAVAVIQTDQASRLQAENQRLRQALVRQSRREVMPSGDILPKTPDRTPDKIGESDEERHARLSAAAFESIRQQREAARLDGSDRPVSYSLIEPGGTGLTPGAAKAAGLNEAQQKRVAEILTKTWTNAADDFAQRAMLVEEESHESSGLLVYQIPARPDRGRDFKARLQGELDGEVGKTMRETLMKGVQRDDFFVGFGASDVRLEFLVGEETFKFAILNPLNGEPRCFGSGVFKEFKERFGESFELPPSSKENPNKKW